MAAVSIADGTARAWLEDGLAEHAAIAAFAWLSLELMVHGAPPKLLEACHRAALDEIRHAQICFELASREAGRDLGPGAFPGLKGMRLPRRDLARLAAESLVDGCSMEGLAAATLRRTAKETGDAWLKETLIGIAGDEERHVELAWEIMAWALDRGKVSVSLKLRTAARLLPEKVQHPIATINGAGRLSVTAQNECWSEVRQSVLARLDILLASRA